MWIFFEQPVHAKDARRLGFILLNKPMDKHSDLSFDSYDRLFPNQDMMPDGGFGNLIALPLQYIPRQSGNSVFIDENCNPYSEQWACLTSVKRISSNQIDEILSNCVF